MPSKVLNNDSPYLTLFHKLLITSPSEYLVAYVILSFALITTINYNINWFSVYFLVITSTTKVICALIISLDESMSYLMLFLMKHNSLSTKTFIYLGLMMLP
jgi:hypothetical protein